MPLTLTLRTTSPLPIEVENILPEAVRTLTAAEIERLPILFGNGRTPLAEHFQIQGSAAEDLTLIWHGDCHTVKRIGTALATGTIRVEGNAGMHLGSEMRGGEILVDGNSGDWTGAEMHGGRITIRGRAGDLLGAVYRGGPKGMTGGEIFVHGDAGDEVGHTMRRGLIAIGGNAGMLLGCHMIAGTIFVGGNCGPRPGAGMKRGTIVLQGAEAPRPLSSFRLATTHVPTFLRPYWKHLQERGFPTGDASDIRFRHYCGDALALGQGELLLREPN